MKKEELLNQVQKIIEKTSDITHDNYVTEINSVIKLLEHLFFIIYSSEED